MLSCTLTGADTLATLVALVLAQTEASPLLFIVENVHWADASTLDFLCKLLEQVAAVPLLVVLTCRPEFAPPWGQRSEMTRVVLNRLTRAQMEAMIVQVASGKCLPEAVVTQVVEKTDGVPLFIEELTRMVLESGQLLERETSYELRGPLTQLTIPVSLHDSLMARLDRLGVGKEMAQWGAVLGRDFSYEVIAAVTPYEEAVLWAGLERVVRSGLIFQRGVVPQARYRFKHALVQEAAYISLLQRQRQAMHHRIAQGLETHFPATVETQPEALAYHYTAVDLPEQAIPYWQRAGQQALQHSAYQEAIGHLNTALDLLSPLPDSPEHRQQELEILQRLGASLRATKGSPDASVLRVYQRLRDLGQQSDEPQQMVPALRGLLQSYRVRGDLQRAQDVAEQLLHLSHNQPDLFFVREAHKNLGLLAMHLGDLVNARAHLEQGMHATTISEESVTRCSGRVWMSGVSCRNFAALVLWMLGYPAQALQCSQEARALARRLSHPQSLVAALTLASRLHQHRREIALAHEYAEASLTLASEHALTHWMILGRIQRGSLLAAQGQITEGFSEMRQGLVVYQARGTRVSLPIFLAQIAEVYGQQGQTAEGLSLLAEAQRVTQQGGERSWEAEQYRLQGELLLQHEDRHTGAAQHGHTPPVALLAEVEACLRQALEVARHQQAKSLELRAAMSLTRL